jgi:hypothetical protein
MVLFFLNAENKILWIILKYNDNEHALPKPDIINQNFDIKECEYLDERK